MACIAICYHTIGFNLKSNVVLWPSTTTLTIWFDESIAILSFVCIFFSKLRIFPCVFFSNHISFAPTFVMCSRLVLSFIEFWISFLTASITAVLQNILGLLVLFCISLISTLQSSFYWACNFLSLYFFFYVNFISFSVSVAPAHLVWCVIFFVSGECVLLANSNWLGFQLPASLQFQFLSLNWFFLDSLFQTSVC